MKLADKTVLITGASDGIGKSMARQLAKQKANLIIFGRDQARLEAVKRECESAGVKVASFAFDLTDAEKRREVVKQILESQVVDVLINNAGVWHKPGDLTTLTEEKIQETININLTAQIMLTHSLLDHMRSRETAIINIVSRSGIMAQAGQSVYTATKYGLRGFTDVLREDTKKESIRIGAVYQGGTATGIFIKAGDDLAMDNFTEPDDLADVVVFMLSRPKNIWLKEVRVDH